VTHNHRSLQAGAPDQVVLGEDVAANGCIKA
jgi:hypothetical protein